MGESYQECKSILPINVAKRLPKSENSTESNFNSTTQLYNQQDFETENKDDDAEEGERKIKLEPEELKEFEGVYDDADDDGHDHDKEGDYAFEKGDVDLNNAFTGDDNYEYDDENDEDDYYK